MAALSAAAAGRSQMTAAEVAALQNKAGGLSGQLSSMQMELEVGVRVKRWRWGAAVGGPQVSTLIELPWPLWGPTRVDHVSLSSPPARAPAPRVALSPRPATASWMTTT